jgi:hypothetical protein
VIDGRPVLPLALHLEWLAQAVLHDNPGYAFHGVNDLRLLQGVILEADSLAITACTGTPIRNGGELIVPAELHGRRGSRDVVHARAEIVLTQRLPGSLPSAELPKTNPYPYSLAEAYRRFLFHGPDLAGIERLDGISAKAILGVSRSATSPSEWLLHPIRGSWIADPQVIDCAFQMMILWSFAEHDVGSLPCFVKRYRQFRRGFGADLVQIGLRVTEVSGSLVRANVDFTDADGNLIARIEDYDSVLRVPE